MASSARRKSCDAIARGDEAHSVASCIKSFSSPLLTDIPASHDITSKKSSPLSSLYDNVIFFSQASTDGDVK